MGQLLLGAVNAVLPDAPAGVYGGDAGLVDAVEGWGCVGVFRLGISPRWRGEVGAARGQ